MEDNDNNDFEKLIDNNKNHDPVRDFIAAQAMVAIASQFIKGGGI
jgi:hypothetical protein